VVAESVRNVSVAIQGGSTAIDPNALGILGIVLSVVLALVFFILGIRVRRPKLVGAGAGSGQIQVPGKDVMASSIQIDNRPSFWGMRIRRETAKIQSARINDPSLREYVGPTLRRRQGGSNELEQQISIEAGKSAHLYLFAKERHSDAYFIYHSTALNADLIPPLIKYTEANRDFSVVLFDEIGRTYRFNITVRNRDQSVGIQLKLTWHARWEMIREAFRLLRGAFSGAEPWVALLIAALLIQLGPLVIAALLRWITP
jgi:hypothetical protein